MQSAVSSLTIFLLIIRMLNVCLSLSFFFSQGTGVEADGPDGGGEPAASVCKRPHLPRQLHLRQL